MTTTGFNPFRDRAYLPRETRTYLFKLCTKKTPWSSVCTPGERDTACCIGTILVTSTSLSLFARAIYHGLLFSIVARRARVTGSLSAALERQSREQTTSQKYIGSTYRAGVLRISSNPERISKTMSDRICIHNTHRLERLPRRRVSDFRAY